MFPTFLPPARVANWQGIHPHRPLRILLAEGNRDIRRALGLLLRSDGHDVIDAADGSELLETIASWIIDGDGRQFDVIIATHSMPGIPGLCVLAGLRARGEQTPFILLTDNAAVMSRAKVLDGIVLDGPLNVESIRRAVHQVELSAPTELLSVSAGILATG